MARRNYERLAIEPFGRQLITSGDLDPVYIALQRLKLSWPREQIARWLIAYWCFYHCGLASHASEFQGTKFWELLHAAALNDTLAPPGGRWPRGHERRHARGVQGCGMIVDLETRYGEHPGAMVDYILGGTRISKWLQFQDVANRVKEHTLFGPWIAFKVCDMIDRVLGVPVSFEQAHIFMFKDPVRAAEMLYRERSGISREATIKIKTAAIIPGVVAYLEKEYSDLKAPPLWDRPIGLQEVETVLCKWKSHMNGHYPLNNDIDEIQDGLQGWGQAAEAFSAMMPERVDV